MNTKIKMENLNFKILATFTKSFDNKHGSSGSSGLAGLQFNNKLHLIASTVVYFGDLNYQWLINSFSNDKRKKKNSYYRNIRINQG